MNRRYRVIEIPLKASTEEEVIELSIDNLPDVAELVDLLRNELSPLSLWLHAALTYYREGKEEEFRDILETVRADTEKSHLQLTPWILEMSTMPDYKQDLLRILDTLAAYYVAQANKERNRERKKELQNKVAVLYTAGDKLTTESHAEGPSSSSSSSSSKNKDAQDNRHELNHLVGRAFFLLVDLNQNNFANALDQADQQFTFVFNNNNANIPTLVGKACISFNKKDYKGALTYYRRCLRNNPQCPANIRLGMGHCFYKLNQLEKARLAFERALKLDHKCVGAMVALAIMELNKKNPEAIQNGVQMLSRAYNIDKTHPMVLNHLADHFFFKRDYQRVHQLALHAFQNTENEFMRAESSYQLGRAYHIQENYNQAFQYYYQSTQFAAPSFVLPFYGLGQMYIFRGDLENAAVCFDRVLKFYPNNYETMKILGSIYAQSADPAKRGMARDYLKKVTEAHPDDVEAWIELAQILEQFDLQGALNSYNNAIKIFKEIAENTGREEPEIPAEIYNNVAVLHYRLGAFEAAEENLERSLRVANDEAEHDEAYFRLIQVSIRYNFGRLYEATYRLVKANEVYVALLRDHPTHTDSMIRLGCLRREACHIYEASDWFKEVLQVDKDNADAWILIANMHCAKSEWGPGQKKYERVLGAEATKDDTYALVALGNIWLHTLFSGGKGGGATREEREKERRHQERAISMYRNALRQDALNLYAANGIGCVLAAKGAFNEARDVFSQVREATADFPDVWVNIAHIYVETRQYVNAIQMYENCHRRFYPAPNTEILMYIARAYYRWGRMRQCKTVLLRIRHITPNDATVIFNLALVLQRIAASVLEEPKCPLRTILSAVHELNLAHRYFDHLRLNPEPTKFDPVAAGAEEQRCKDLITQAQHHVARARRADAEEQEARRRQEAERAALRAKAQEETRAREEERRKVEKELIAKRQEFVAKTKSILIFDPQMEEKPKKGGGGGGRGRKSAHHGEDGFVTDSSSNIENRTAGGGGGGEKTGGKKKKKKKEGKRGRKRRNRGSGGSAESDEEGGGGGEVNEEERRKRREERQQQKRKKQRKGGQKESAKKGRPSKPEKAEQPGKFKSKAYISSSDSSSSSSGEGAGKKAAESAAGGAAGSDQDDDRENVPKVSDDVMPDLSSSDSDGAGDRRRKKNRRSRSRSASSRSSRSRSVGSRSVGSRSRSSSQSGAESPQVQKKKKQQKQQSPKKTAKAKGRRGRILSESSQSSQGSDLEDRPPASSPVRRSPSSASSSRSEGEEEGGGAGVRASSSRSSSLHSSPANRGGGGGGGGGGGSSSSEDDSRPYYRPAQPTDRDSDSEVERSPKSNHNGSGEEEDSDGSRRSGGRGPAAVGGAGRGSDVSRSGSDDSD